MDLTFPLTYKVFDDKGQSHLCHLHAMKVRRINPERVFLELWFRPVIITPGPETIVYGPYLWGWMEGRPIRDNRVQPSNDYAERKLDEMLARARGMRYQETPFLRIGGDPGIKKVYTKG